MENNIYSEVELNDDEITTEETVVDSEPEEVDKTETEESVEDKFSSWKRDAAIFGVGTGVGFICRPLIVKAAKKVAKKIGARHVKEPVIFKGMRVVDADYTEVKEDKKAKKNKKTEEKESKGDYAE